MAATQSVNSCSLFEEKGPAEVAASPSHGPNNPTQEKAMDTHSDITPAASPATEEPHAKAHRLLLELSEVLDNAFDGRFGATVMPAYLRGKSWPSGFLHIQSHQLAWARAHRAQRYLRRIMTMSAEERTQHYRKRLQRAARLQEAAI